MRRYTLIELLVVVGSISGAATILSVLAPALERPIPKTSLAKSELHMLRVAVFAYCADTGRFPQPGGYDRTALASVALRDASPWLYAALLNPPERGGGPNAPYLEWKRIGVLAERDALLGSEMGSDGHPTALPWAGQNPAAHGPSSPQPLVLLDPWGNPYHYREWQSVPFPTKKAGLEHPVRRMVLSNGDGMGFSARFVEDFPRAIDEFDLWSQGRDGANDYGTGDDLPWWR